MRYSIETYGVEKIFDLKHLDWGRVFFLLLNTTFSIALLPSKTAVNRSRMWAL